MNAMSTARGALISRIVTASRRGYHAAMAAVVESRINRHGVGSVGFIDIGSAGLLPKPWIYHPSSIRRLLKFDPRARQGSNSSVDTVDVAVWSENTRRLFYIYSGSGGAGSSLFRQNIEYVDGNFEMLRQRGPRRLAETWHERSRLVETIEIDCKRLDDLLDERGDHAEYNFIKIDAQGAELAILHGATRLLEGTCVGLQLELFSLPLYEGAPLIDEVITFLADYGFRVAKKFPPHGSFDSQQDCLFLRDAVAGDPLATVKTVYGVD